MKKIFTLILCLMMTVSLIGCSTQKVVATVNGQELSLGNYEKLLQIYKSSMESYYGDDMWSKKTDEGETYEDNLKNMVLETMTGSEVVYQEAEKQKVTPTDEQIKQQIDTFNKQIESNTSYKKKLKDAGIDDEFLKYQFSRDLANANLQEKYEKDLKLTDKEMKKYYNDNKKTYYTNTVTASHILIKTQDSNGKDLSKAKQKQAKEKAEKVLAKVKAGGDFAELAKQYSEDTGSASKGGELGTFGKGEMVSEFEDAAFSMKAGEISDLVKTEYGYHIIKVTKRVNKQETYDEVKDKIKSTLASQKYTEYTTKLKKESKIETKEDIVKSAKF